MYWGPECEVLEPAELIAMVVSDLQAVGRIYPQQPATSNQVSDLQAVGRIYPEAKTALFRRGPAADERE